MRKGTRDLTIPFGGKEQMSNAILKEKEGGKGTAGNSRLVQLRSDHSLELRRFQLIREAKRLDVDHCFDAHVWEAELDVFIA